MRQYIPQIENITHTHSHTRYIQYRRWTSNTIDNSHNSQQTILERKMEEAKKEWQVSHQEDKMRKDRAKNVALELKDRHRAEYVGHCCPR
mmetsp:Transcript_23286/g.24807  ORF Transcript_23286/g.24807 Transcript_23286/m.24807 type:complete len:90 (+) Transcript_23286:363-632(+)